MTSFIICMIIGCFLGWLIARCEHEWKKKQQKKRENGSEQ